MICINMCFFLTFIYVYIFVYICMYIYGCSLSGYVTHYLCCFPHQVLGSHRDGTEAHSNGSAVHHHARCAILRPFISLPLSMSIIHH